jgi:hypothetical protein
LWSLIFLVTEPGISGFPCPMQAETPGSAHLWKPQTIGREVFSLLSIPPVTFPFTGANRIHSPDLFVAQLLLDMCLEELTGELDERGFGKLRHRFVDSSNSILLIQRTRICRPPFHPDAEGAFQLR